VISESVFDSYKIKHLGERENDVSNAVAKITQVKSKLLSKVAKFEAIKLNQDEKQAFLQSALPLRFSEHLELDNPNELLEPLRTEDMKDDLYTTLNILQEQFLSKSSKITGYNKDTGRRFTAKGVTSISKDVEINKGLWDIAERIASIKDPDYQIAA
jgi:sulfate adenylyltransferase subunit 1 (EFTu-like GTPase family)